MCASSVSKITNGLFSHSEYGIDLLVGRSKSKSIFNALMRRSSGDTGLDVGLNNLASYAPSEVKKESQFTAFNQFPYTLEQEVVAKMAPIVHSGTSIHAASYKPVLDNLHDASPLTGSD